jgi:hypothetical protein
MKGCQFYNVCLPALAVNVKEDMLNMNREMGDILNKESDKYKMNMTEMFSKIHFC